MENTGSDKFLRIYGKIVLNWIRREVTILTIHRKKDELEKKKRRVMLVCDVMHGLGSRE
jgi:hypothetical protein